MNRLRELRNDKGVSVDKLAKSVGNSRANISRYERGLTQPSLETWEKLAKFFNVTPQYLVGWSDER